MLAVKLVIDGPLLPSSTQDKASAWYPPSQKHIALLLATAQTPWFEQLTPSHGSFVVASSPTVASLIARPASGAAAVQALVLKPPQFGKQASVPPPANPKEAHVLWDRL